MGTPFLIYMFSMAYKDARSAPVFPNVRSVSFCSHFRLLAAAKNLSLTFSSRELQTISILSMFPSPRCLLTASFSMGLLSGFKPASVAPTVSTAIASLPTIAWQSRSFIFFSVSFHRGLFSSDDPSVYRSFFQRACFSCSYSVTSASVNTKHIQRH